MKLRELLAEKFDMKSSLENSITAWKIALKKTSNKEKQKYLTDRITIAENKIKQIEKNSK